jgi:nucleotide-binding universal stress UspA family protein
MKPNKIIIAVDYTHSAVNAYLYAQLLASTSNCELLLFHVYDAPVVHTNSGLFFMDMPSLKKSDPKKLNTWAAKHLMAQSGLQYETLNTNGSFKDEIEKLVKTKQVFAVIMGLDSKSKINKFIYGSHTTQLAGKIDCPVIIVPESYQQHAIGKMILAVDNNQALSKKSSAQLKWLVERSGSILKAVHIKTPDEILSSEPAIFIVGQSSTIPVQIKKADDLIEGITSAVNQSKSNGVIIISRKHSLLYRFFNESHTKEIAFSSKVPAIVIHE